MSGPDVVGSNSIMRYEREELLALQSSPLVTCASIYDVATDFGVPESLLKSSRIGKRDSDIDARLDKGRFFSTTRFGDAKEEDHFLLEPDSSSFSSLQSNRVDRSSAFARRGGHGGAGNIEEGGSTSRRTPALSPSTKDSKWNTSKTSSSSNDSKPLNRSRVGPKNLSLDDQASDVVSLKPPFTVYVSNLDSRSSEKDIKDLFRGLKVILVRKHGHRAHVTFDDEESLRKSLQLSGTKLHNKLVHISIHERPSLSKVKHASEKEDEENAPFESKATPSTSAHHDPDVIVSPDVAEQLRTFLKLNDSSKICVEEQSESSQANPSHAPRTSSSNVERERFSSLLSGLVQTASSIAPHDSTNKNPPTETKTRTMHGKPLEKGNFFHDSDSIPPPSGVSMDLLCETLEMEGNETYDEPPDAWMDDVEVVRDENHFANVENGGVDSLNYSRDEDIDSSTHPIRVLDSRSTAAPDDVNASGWVLLTNREQSDALKDLLIDEDVTKQTTSAASVDPHLVIPEDPWDTFIRGLEHDSPSRSSSQRNNNPIQSIQSSSVHIPSPYRLHPSISSTDESVRVQMLDGSTLNSSEHHTGDQQRTYAGQVENMLRKMLSLPDHSSSAERYGVPPGQSNMVPMSSVDNPSRVVSTPLVGSGIMDPSLPPGQPMVYGPRLHSHILPSAVPQSAMHGSLGNYSVTDFPSSSHVLSSQLKNVSSDSTLHPSEWSGYPSPNNGTHVLNARSLRGDQVRLQMQMQRAHPQRPSGPSSTSAPGPNIIQASSALPVEHIPPNTLSNEWRRVSYPVQHANHQYVDSQGRVGIPTDGSIVPQTVAYSAQNYTIPDYSAVMLPQAVSRESGMIPSMQMSSTHVPGRSYQARSTPFVGVSTSNSFVAPRPSYETDESNFHAPQRIELGQIFPHSQGNYHQLGYHERK